MTARVVAVVLVAAAITIPTLAVLLLPVRSVK